MKVAAISLFLTALGLISATAQQPPYDKFPAAEAPYYRVRYLASDNPGELIFPVKYTVWVPEGVETLRGVIVHQHGCGEGSCKSGLTAAWDLHWQALAKKHDCALLGPSYEQPKSAECQMWCDPRNGSDATFHRALADLGKLSGHPELTTVPWALWGHSGGGHWAGGMTLLHPNRVAAAWLRSGVPLLEPNPERPQITPHELPDAALQVPIMCNPGTKEGVTVTTGRFSKTWLANKRFLTTIRAKGGQVGVAVDPLTAHECGNSRYLAIPWLDACLSARLPAHPGKPLKPMPTKDSYLAPFLGSKAVPRATYTEKPETASWLPNRTIAEAWTHFVRDTNIPDLTPPPAPTNIRVDGKTITWRTEADLESGISHFIVQRDGVQLAKVEGPKNRFGRPLFQGLQYSDTPTFPLTQMMYTDTNQQVGKKHHYNVIAVNTVGLASE